MTRFCTVEGCGRPLDARGLCSTHYRRMREGRPLDAPIRGTAREALHCTLEGCGAPIKARGLCELHYRRALHGRPLDGQRPEECCTVAGCARKAYAKGLCREHHWQRARRGALCTVEGCDRRADEASVTDPTSIWTDGLCRLHLDRLRLGVERARLGEADHLCALCDSPRVSRGLCQRHARRRDAGLPLDGGESEVERLRRELKEARAALEVAVERAAKEATEQVLALLSRGAL